MFSIFLRSSLNGVSVYSLLSSYRSKGKVLSEFMNIRNVLGERVENYIDYTDERGIGLMVLDNGDRISVMNVPKDHLRSYVYTRLVWRVVYRDRKKEVFCDFDNFDGAVLVYSGLYRGMMKNECVDYYHNVDRVFDREVKIELIYN